MGNEQIEEALYITGEIVFTIYENVDQHFSIAKIKIIETNEDLMRRKLSSKATLSNYKKGSYTNFTGRSSNIKSSVYNMM